LRGRLPRNVFFGPRTLRRAGLRIFLACGGRDPAEGTQVWLFPQVLAIVKRWLAHPFPAHKAHKGDACHFLSTRLKK
jgi:hypothetical protein